MTDVVDTIRNHYSSLSKTHKKIADSVLDNPTEYFVRDIGDSARALAVSEASLTRFARAIGYKGYGELKRICQSQLVHAMSSFGIKEKLVESIESESSLDSIRQNLIRERDHFAAEVEALNTDALNELAEALTKARTIYVIGLGAAATIVEFLSFRFRRIGFDVRKLNEGGYALIEKLSALGSADLLLAIGFQRVYDEVLTAAEHAKKVGCQLFVWTENPFSKLALVCGNYVVLKRGEKGRLNSVALPLSVANAVAIKAASLLGEKLNDAVNTLDHMNRQLQSHLGGK